MLVNRNPYFYFADSNIPETGEQLMKSTHGSGCCYEYCEQRRNVNPSTSNYRPLDKSTFPYTRIVSCLRNCNDSQSDDPSHKTTKSSPCQNSPKTASTSTSSTPHTAVPFVNFPLSSCPSPHSASKATHEEFVNTIALCFVLGLLIIVKNILDSSGLR